ncbi:MAG TPA: hypothetical protein VMW56_26275 [Candidatus Margulisiibacteriota bacterium]|nr:hypothetical protein [Candidatus Margulisiibacteriota bacterium]
MKRQHVVGSLLMAIAFCGALAGPSGAQCTGDCDDDDQVSVGEVITGVNIALDITPLTECSSFDTNQSNTVSVDEILAAVNNALNGCRPQPTPTVRPGVCGDGVVDFALGETCDDGNTLDGDACPATCRIRTCTASGTHVRADVQFSAPAGVDLAGIVVFVRYPDGVVRIPGTAMDASVVNSILNLSDNAFSTPNDLDYALRVVIFTPDSSALPAGRLFTIQFEGCTGASPPQASDFTCSVESATGTNNDPVNGATCSVSLP